MILLSIAGVTGKSTDRVINALLTAQDRLTIAEASLKKIDRSIADGTTMDDSDLLSEKTPPRQLTTLVDLSQNTQRP